MGGGGSWAHGRAADLSLALRRLWRQYTQVFTRQKNLSENCAKFGQAPEKMFPSALLSRKNLRKIHPKGYHISNLPGCQINGLPRAVTRLELARQRLKCLLDSDENRHRSSVQQVMDRAEVSWK